MTRAGSSWPPLALMCTPGPAAAASEEVSCRAKMAPNAATPERPADLLEEHPGAAGHPHVLLLHAVLRDQRDHLHEEAHAEAEHHEVQAGGDPAGAHAQAGEQVHAHGHDGAAQDREHLVAAGPGGDLPGHIEVTVTPSIIGVSISPLTVGDAPCTVCWYSGRKVIAPNMARPVRNVIAIVSEKLPLRKTCSGSMGSAARVSVIKNPATAATVTSASPTISGEPQAYCVPPQVASRMSAVAATASSVPPR